jgi:hypothetical protein
VPKLFANDGITDWFSCVHDCVFLVKQVGASPAIDCILSVVLAQNANFSGVDGISACRLVDSSEHAAAISVPKYGF